MAERVDRGIALLFHGHGTRRRWVVSSTPRPHFTPGKDPILILQEAEWAPGPVWTGGKSRPHRDSIPDRPARSQSLYRLSYLAHTTHRYYLQIYFSTGYRSVLNRSCDGVSVAGVQKLGSLRQCFSTFVRPRPGKFLFHTTRARSQ